MVLGSQHGASDYASHVQGAPHAASHDPSPGQKTTDDGASTIYDDITNKMIKEFNEGIKSQVTKGETSELCLGTGDFNPGQIVQNQKEFNTIANTLLGANYESTEMKYSDYIDDTINLISPPSLASYFSEDEVQKWSEYYKTNKSVTTGPDQIFDDKMKLFPIFARRERVDSRAQMGCKKVFRSERRMAIYRKRRDDSHADFSFLPNFNTAGVGVGFKKPDLDISVTVSQLDVLPASVHNGGWFDDYLFMEAMEVDGQMNKVNEKYYDNFQTQSVVLISDLDFRINIDNSDGKIDKSKLENQIKKTGVLSLKDPTSITNTVTESNNRITITSKSESGERFLYGIEVGHLIEQKTRRVEASKEHLNTFSHKAAEDTQNTVGNTKLLVIAVLALFLVMFCLILILVSNWMAGTLARLNGRNLYFLTWVSITAVGAGTAFVFGAFRRRHEFQGIASDVELRSARTLIQTSL